MWDCFLGRRRLHDHIQESMEACKFGSDSTATCCKLLQEMFAAPGKTRHELYHSMLADAGIGRSFSSVKFGDEARALYEGVKKSVHRKHPLAFYSVELLLEAYFDLHSNLTFISEGRLEAFFTL